MDNKILWIFKSFDEERSFGGNEGYADEPELCYLYDNTVINHNRVKAGDLAIIISKKHIKGIAQIDKIEIEPDMPKKQYSCPICGTKKHTSRKRAIPKYRCTNRHEFDEPVISSLSVTQYKAIYSPNYKRISEKMAASLINPYYTSYNAYYSIQSANLTLLEAHFSQFYLSEKIDLSEPHTPYIPSISDSRDYRILKASIRPEQSKFRQQLVEIHGMSCMVSDCTVPEAIDASHICPYMGPNDNHLSNGVLLRKDLHALFDADMLAIEPSTLKIHVSLVLENTSYMNFAQCVLKIKRTSIPLSPLALSIKWDVFKRKQLALLNTKRQN